MLKAAQAYVQTQVSTTNQGNLLILLYEGAIKYLKQAKIHIEEKNYAKKGILISKAMDVISELDSSLNSQKGGELAQNLHQLYFLCNTRLLRANLHMKVELIDEVIGILDGLRSAFVAVVNTPGAQQAQNAAQNNLQAPAMRPAMQPSAHQPQAPQPNYQRPTQPAAPIPHPAAKPEPQPAASQAEAGPAPAPTSAPTSVEDAQQLPNTYSRPGARPNLTAVNNQPQISRSRQSSGANAYRRIAEHIKP